MVLAAECPRGTVATLGHPSNGVLIVKGTSGSGWRYVDNGLRVDNEDFRGRWDIVSMPAMPQGERLVELNFVRPGDSRKPATVRIQIQDADSARIMTSVDLDEHQFVALLAGSVVTAKDAI